ncbi:hypothetical protein [Rhizocola hellebori]|uniref:hypothetical protein n=1 Tax=Rhizocola hellebori TaxID=1392758 RepID=UPI0019420E45|nr:hypothetical protein [Rhizocola hellebori]
MTEQRSAMGRLAGDGKWPAFAGVGLGLFGHLLAIAAVLGLALWMGGGDADADLDSGGRFAVMYGMLCLYVVMQVLLVFGISIVSEFGGRSWSRGVFAGWYLGWALTIGGVVALFNSVP